MVKVNMNGAPNLVLITSAFPFGRGEQFLEAEVKVLSQYFDCVTIFPHKKYGEKRGVPDNVIVNEGFAGYIACDGVFRKVIRALAYIFKMKPRLRPRLSDIKALLISSYYADCAEGYFAKEAESLLAGKDRLIFYSYWFYPSTIGLLAVRELFAADRIKVAVRAHRTDLYEEAQGIVEFPYRRMQINKFDRIYSISEHGVDHLRKMYGASNVCVSRLGTRTPEEVLAKKNDGVVTIVSCSFINHVKRVEKILDVVFVYAKLNPGLKVRWMHIGTGPLKSNLIGRIKTLNILNLDCNLLGNMTNSQVHEFYKSTYVDVFINLSESEGIPVSIMEAMSYGIPVVATRVGGVPEIVESGAGVLVEVDSDSSSIARSLINFINEGSKGSARFCAKEIWSNKYNAEENYRKFAIDLVNL